MLSSRLSASLVSLGILEFVSPEVSEAIEVVIEVVIEVMINEVALYLLGGLMGNKLYVGNLAFSTTEQDLSTAFAQCGNVASVKIITDRESGRSKGFAFVEMATGEEAAKAISQFNGKDLNGRPVVVNEARPMEPRSGGGGGGGGYGGGGGGGGGRGRR